MTLRAAPATVDVGVADAHGLAFLLVPPLAWLVVAYLGSLAVLLVSAFWSTNSFTGAVVRTFTSDNIMRVLTDEVFRTATVRTVGVALAVTVHLHGAGGAAGALHGQDRLAAMRLALVVAVTTPLWASYLVKAYAWRMLLSPEGPLAWATGYTPGYGLVATIITLTYLWLPYMVIPVFAAFDRVPELPDGCQLRPGRLGHVDAANGGRAVGVSRYRRRLDLHVLAVAR